MAVSDTISGAGFSLCPVVENDADFLVELRSNKQLTAFLPPLDPEVEKQRAWIGKQRQAENDYYFTIVADGSNERHGAVGLYNKQADGGFEWGRWIVRPGSLAATESALLVYRFAFELLKVPYVFCQTVARNESVVGFHDSSGLKRTRVVPGRFVIRDVAFDAVEHRVDSLDWPQVKARLEPVARRVAMRARR